MCIRDSTNADGVNPGMAQAEQVVEDDRVQRCAELQQTLGGAVEVPTLVGGTDHEDPHVMGLGRRNSRAVVLANEIPVEIDVVEGIAGDGLFDQGEGAVGGEADAAHAPIPLPAPRHLHATPRFEGGLQMLGKVDAVDRQAIHTIHGQAIKAQRQLRLKGRRIILGGTLVCRIRSASGTWGNNQPSWRSELP